ncbi:hypothetical protein AMK22_14750 [Streptomyces sp. CB01580]|nr:hypothetical protein AMK22_14750 [Streptomyces sp. CB01580]
MRGCSWLPGNHAGRLAPKPVPPVPARAARPPPLTSYGAPPGPTPPAPAVTPAPARNPDRAHGPAPLTPCGP